MNWLYSLWDNRTFGAARSPKWSEVQKSFIALHSTCAVCGTKGKLLNPLNVHHRLPFHKDPSKELDENNLITLCRKCHFIFGHLNNWSSWNVTIKEDAAQWLLKITNRP